MDPVSARLVFLLLNSTAEAALEAVSKRVQIPPETPGEVKQAILPIINQHVQSTHAAFNSLITGKNTEVTPDGYNVSFHSALATALAHLEQGAVDIAKRVIGDALGLPPDTSALPPDSDQNKLNFGDGTQVNVAPEVQTPIPDAAAGDAHE